MCFGIRNVFGTDPDLRIRTNELGTDPEYYTFSIILELAFFVIPEMAFFSLLFSSWPFLLIILELAFFVCVIPEMAFFCLFF